MRAARLQPSRRHDAGLLAAAAGRGLGIDWVLETHAHADSPSARGAPYIKLETGARVDRRRIIRDVRRFSRPVVQCHRLEGRRQGSSIASAPMSGFRSVTSPSKSLNTPGHTPADVSYKIGDAVFVAQTRCSMPDYRTARADFPGGDAHCPLSLNPEIAGAAGFDRLHVPRL